MEPLHATIEEFAAEGLHSHRVLLPSMSHDEVEADQLASSHLVGPHHRAAIIAAPLCGVRRSIALSQAVADRPLSIPMPS